MCTSTFVCTCAHLYQYVHIDAIMYVYTTRKLLYACYCTVCVWLRVSCMRYGNGGKPAEEFMALKLLCKCQTGFRYWPDEVAFPS